jgi:hypothetical protein
MWAELFSVVALAALPTTSAARAADPIDVPPPPSPSPGKEETPAAAPPTAPTTAAPPAAETPSPAPAPAATPRRPTETAPILRGPHPFRSENALNVTGGYGFANEFHGIRAGIGYGYELAGSLWFDLRIDVIDASSDIPPDRSLPACATCGEVETFAAVLGGLAYRLRADIPVIPYAAVNAGPVFLFNRGTRGAVGMALRASAGARYYFYEWLGLGLELGTVLGGVVVDDASGLSANLVVFDMGLSGEFQF